MESFIHQHKKKTAPVLDSAYYGSIKNYDFVDEDNNPRIKEEQDSRVLAKIKTKDDGSKKYLIRLDNLKKLYDPTLDMSENKSTNLFDIDGAEIPFKEVNKKTFNLYLSFLRTMNTSWIRNAEREDF
jgi:hypothetical protein